jgi:hypothetical protein
LLLKLSRRAERFADTAESRNNPSAAVSAAMSVGDSLGKPRNLRKVSMLLAGDSDLSELTDLLEVSGPRAQRARLDSLFVYFVRS